MVFDKSVLHRKVRSEANVCRRSTLKVVIKDHYFGWHANPHHKGYAHARRNLGEDEKLTERRGWCTANLIIHYSFNCSLGSKSSFSEFNIITS
jgi:hypothetical protein